MFAAEMPPPRNLAAESSEQNINPTWLAFFRQVRHLARLAEQRANAGDEEANADAAEKEN